MAASNLAGIISSGVQQRCMNTDETSILDGACHWGLSLTWRAAPAVLAAAGLNLPQGLTHCSASSSSSSSSSSREQANTTYNHFDEACSDSVTRQVNTNNLNVNKPL
jgi:hypothetical protein